MRNSNLINLKNHPKLVLSQSKDQGSDKWTGLKTRSTLAHYAFYELRFDRNRNLFANREAACLRGRHSSRGRSPCGEFSSLQQSNARCAPRVLYLRRRASTLNVTSFVTRGSLGLHAMRSSSSDLCSTSSSGRSFSGYFSTSKKSAFFRCSSRRGSFV